MSTTTKITQLLDDISCDWNNLYYSCSAVSVGDGFFILAMPSLSVSNIIDLQLEAAFFGCHYIVKSGLVPRYGNQITVYFAKSKRLIDKLRYHVIVHSDCIFTPISRGGSNES